MEASGGPAVAGWNAVVARTVSRASPVAGSGTLVEDAFASALNVLAPLFGLLGAEHVLDVALEIPEKFAGVLALFDTEGVDAVTVRFENRVDPLCLFLGEFKIVLETGCRPMGQPVGIFLCFGGVGVKDHYGQPAADHGATEQ